VLFDRLRRACLHIASGITSLEQMRDGVRHRWQDFAVDDDAIDAGLLPWEDAFATRFLRAGSRVLIVGCGTGRDVIALARLGHQVIGIDPAAPAVAAGRRALTRRQLSAELIDGFFEDRDWPAEFDAVSFSSYTYSYIPEASRRIGALRRASAALRPGGHILLNVFLRPDSERLAYLGGWVARLTGNDWTPGPGDSTPTLPGTEHLHFEHCFDQSQLDQELTAAGLQPVATLAGGTALVLRPLNRH
jgi:SAM-dependent methyltransferase